MTLFPGTEHGLGSTCDIRPTPSTIQEPLSTEAPPAGFRTVAAVAKREQSPHQWNVCPIMSMRGEFQPQGEAFNGHGPGHADGTRSVVNNPVELWIMLPIRETTV